jgi:hypothetical protein
MVHAIMVVTVDDMAGPAPLLWHGYTREWNIPRESAQRNVAALAQQVFADFRLRSACDESFASSGRIGPSQTSSSASSSDRALILPQFSVPEGVLRFAVPSSSEGEVLRVVWRFIPPFAAVAGLALQDGESLGMAQHVLAILCRVMCEQTSAGALQPSSSSSSSSSVSSSSSSSSSSSRGTGKAPAAVRKELFEARPDEAAILLEHFLPSGQLVLMNTSYAKHLRKEAETLMASKS